VKTSLKLSQKVFLGLDDSGIKAIVPLNSSMRQSVPKINSKKSLRCWAITERFMN